MKYGKVTPPLKFFGVNVGPNGGPPVNKIGGVIVPISPLETQLKNPEPYSTVIYGADERPRRQNNMEQYEERIPWDPYPMSNGLGLANNGGYYNVVQSNKFWNERAPGQVVQPSWVDYYDTHYLIGPAFLTPPESQTPHRLHYGTSTNVAFGYITGVAVIGGLAMLYVLFIHDKIFKPKA